MTYWPTFGRLELAGWCTFPWNGKQINGRPLRFDKKPDDAFVSLGRAVSTVAELLDSWHVPGGAPPPEVDIAAIAKENDLSETDTKRLERAHGDLVKLRESEADDLLRLPEVPLAYNVAERTGRIFAQANHRDRADIRDGEMWGKPDLVRVSSVEPFDGSGEGLVVRDYKASFGARNKRPRELAQLRACGLAAAKAFGVSSVTIELAHIEADGIRLVRDTLDAWDLAIIANELAEIVSRVETARVPHVGPWCHEAYCPVLAKCPATLAHIEQLRVATEPRFPITAELTSLEHATYQYDRLKVLGKALAVYEHAVKAWAREEPLPIGDGEFYGEVNKTNEAVDTDVEAFEQVLVDHGLGDAIEREVKVTKDALNHAIKVATEGEKRGAQKRLREAVWRALDNAGAVRRSEYTKLDKFKKKEKAA